MRLLLADDDIISLRLLENLLKKSNHEIILAHDGDEAWALLQQTPTPNMAILDWMMPGLDGIEITKRLRQKETTEFVYIILVTANSQPEDITAGLDSGANDYITKPFNKDELKSRIAVGCRIVEYETSLKKKNEELHLFSSKMEQLAQNRAQQLVQADRMVTLGTMAAGIAHEINNPLTVINGNLGLIKGFWKSIGEDVYRKFCNEDTDKPNDFRPEPNDIADMIQTAASSVKRIRNIIDGMRSFAHGQGGKIEELNLINCINDAIQICQPKLKHLSNVETEFHDVPFALKGNPVQITQALVNLIANSADAVAGKPTASIKATLQTKKNHVEMMIIDNGSGIPEDKIEELWSPFYTTKPVGKGTGLGLAITRKIIIEHGGDISVQSTEGFGTQFKINLPKAEDYDAFIKNRQNQKSMEEPSLFNT